MGVLWLLSSLFPFLLIVKSLVLDRKTILILMNLLLNKLFPSLKIYAGRTEMPSVRLHSAAILESSRMNLHLMKRLEEQARFWTALHRNTQRLIIVKASSYLDLQPFILSFSAHPQDLATAYLVLCPSFPTNKEERKVRSGLNRHLQKKESERRTTSPFKGAGVRESRC